jgi:hypothetical protein
MSCDHDTRGRCRRQTSRNRDQARCGPVWRCRWRRIRYVALVSRSASVSLLLPPATHSIDVSTCVRIRVIAPGRQSTPNYSAGISLRWSTDCSVVTGSRCADGQARRPDSVLPKARRPSIYRHRPPHAIYPRTGADRPRKCAHSLPEDSEILDLAPGGVCLVALVTPGRRWSHTPPFHLSYPGRGGLLSLALSRRLPGVTVNRHSAPWSPGLPRRRPMTSTRSPGQPIRPRSLRPHLGLNEAETAPPTAAKGQDRGT